MLFTITVDMRPNGSLAVWAQKEGNLTRGQELKFHRLMFSISKMLEQENKILDSAVISDKHDPIPSPKNTHE